MSLMTGILVYTVIWWMIFLMMLPIGVRAQEEDGGTVEPGTPESAPKKPRLLFKAALATVISAAIFAVIYVIIDSGAISFRQSV